MGKAHGRAFGAGLRREGGGAGEHVNTLGDGIWCLTSRWIPCTPWCAPAYLPRRGLSGFPCHDQQTVSALSNSEGLGGCHTPSRSIRMQAQGCWQGCGPSNLSALSHPRDWPRDVWKRFGVVLFPSCTNWEPTCFPYRSGQQGGTNYCHCSGGAGPPDFPPSSRLPPPPLPQAPTWPGKKPSLAMLGRSVFPWGAAGLTRTGHGAQRQEPALPGHPRDGCTQGRGGWRN